MKLTQRPRAEGRRGFTLLEVLIVVAIILVLMGLVASVAIRAASKGDEVRTQSEISQLATQVTNFQTNYGVPYVPSRLVLRAQPSDYNTGDPLESDSVQYLTRVFPRWNQAADWTGSGGAFPVLLEGDQCLVFFLGGIRSGAALTGFSTNPNNPAAAGGDRTRPLYEFQTSRLIVLPASGSRSTFHPSYKDPYGIPYAYFSSYKSSNNYNRYTGSDCATLGVSPYFDSAGPPLNFLKSNSFQIISAGKNSTFGPGGLWTPTNPIIAGGSPNPYDVNQAGYDDMSNFHNLLLGRGL
jgi:prepilin-type N-terminal cleavage/methylation domain-containing protein